MTGTAAPTAPWGSVPDGPTVWPTPAQEDLLRATLLPDERALRAWRRIRPGVAATTLDGGAGPLLPHLRRNLRALGVEDPLLDLFKGVHRHAWARNQFLLASATPVIAALETAGIPTLLLKGVSLVAGERQNAGMRQMSDIDLLIPTGQMAPALELVHAHGMRPVENLPLWYLVQYGPLFKHSCNFLDGHGGELDIHWHALQRSRHPDADLPFWEGAEPIVLGGVRTRALCPADDLLVGILHGLLWNPTPTLRWVLDATLIVRGVCGPVDYGRLAEQARRHRVSVAVTAALGYLRRLGISEVPCRAGRRFPKAAPLQQLELRAQTRPARGRSALGHGAGTHMQYVRQRAAPGSTVTPAGHLRLAAERLGLRRPQDVFRIGAGGCPGPGRPLAESMAPIGTGACSPPELPWGRPLHLGDPESARAHCLYGLWLPEAWGCWIAGREARLVFTLPAEYVGPLRLTLTAGGLAGTRQRLRVLAGSRPVGEMTFDGEPTVARPAEFTVPAAAVSEARRLELTFQVPDATTPRRLGLNDDPRLLGVFLSTLTLAPAPARAPTADPAAPSIIA